MISAVGSPSASPPSPCACATAAVVLYVARFSEAVFPSNNAAAAEIFGGPTGPPNGFSGPSVTAPPATAGSTAANGLVWALCVSSTGTTLLFPSDRHPSAFVPVGGAGGSNKELVGSPNRPGGPVWGGAIMFTVWGGFILQTPSANLRKQAILLSYQHSCFTGWKSLACSSQRSSLPWMRP